jgi:hypothetical protein
MNEFHFEADFLEKFHGLVRENLYSVMIERNSTHNPMGCGVPRIIFQK